MKNNLVRLQKFMADCGVASRRKSEELIENGAVKLNGKTAVLGDKVNPSVDKVYVHNKRVVMKRKGGKRYIMLNKPRGFVTTMSDEMNRKCVADLVKDIPERVYPVGRLDKDSDGLLTISGTGNMTDYDHPVDLSRLVCSEFVLCSGDRVRIACKSACVDLWKQEG